MKYEGVVSPHEKGFWQVDVYEDKCEEGVTPVWFATGKKGDDMYAVLNKAISVFHDIHFVAGITGVCPECSEEYFELEEVCICSAVIEQE